MASTATTASSSLEPFVTAVLELLNNDAAASPAAAALAASQPNAQLRALASDTADALGQARTVQWLSIAQRIRQQVGNNDAAVRLLQARRALQLLNDELLFSTTVMSPGPVTVVDGKPTLSLADAALFVSVQQFLKSHATAAVEEQAQGRVDNVIRWFNHVAAAAAPTAARWETSVAAAPAPLATTFGSAKPIELPAAIMAAFGIVVPVSYTHLTLPTIYSV